MKLSRPWLERKPAEEWTLAECEWPLPQDAAPAQLATWTMLILCLFSFKCLP